MRPAKKDWSDYLAMFLAATLIGGLIAGSVFIRWNYVCNKSWNCFLSDRVVYVKNQ